MARHFSVPSAGWLIVFGSVACMGASLALAQRAVEPERNAQTPQAAQRDRAPAGTPADPQARERAAQERDTQQRAGEQREAQDSRRVAGAASSAAAGGGIAFEGQDDLIVREVSPGSAAADAGLRPRDRILSVDGRPVTGQRRFFAFLSSLTGRRVPLVVEREGRQYTVQYTPAPANEQGAWLGVYLQDSEQEERGARVTHVYPTGPAARAGLRPGDVILSVNDQQVQSAPDLISVVEAMKPQSKVALRVLRGEREIEATATLASRDSYVFHQGGFDERQGRFADRRNEDDDAFADVPPYAMELEHDRRMAEQHERIETELRKLQEEVRLLREALQRR